MINKVQFVFFTISALLISGCATPTYVPPENGPTAELIFPSKKSSYKLLGGFSSSGSSFAIAGENGCGKFVKVEKSEEKNIKNIIPANKVIFINSGYSIGNTFCSVTGSFLAEKGQTYTVEPKLAGRSCSVVVKNENDGKYIFLERAYVDKWVGKTVCPSKNKQN